MFKNAIKILLIIKKLFIVVLAICFFAPSVANASIPTWRILWIILPKVNVNHTDGVTYNFTLTQDEITKIREMSERVERFIEESTSNAVDIEMTVLESTGTVRNLTDNGTYLYVGEDDFPSDVKKELQRADEEDNTYDVKVATFRLDGDNNAKISDWFGLGGGRYARVHFFKNTKASDFDETPTSPHPEEVWVHELIHCFESIFENLGTMAGLHDNAKYGYSGENGWSKWYHDILAGQVKNPSTGEFVGIKSDMWQHISSGRIAYWKGHTYKILDTVRTWSTAKSYCESLGGHLVTITSEEEQNVVATLLKQASTWNYYGYWMGGQRDTKQSSTDGNNTSRNGKWHWVTGEAFKYTKFSDIAWDGYGNYLQMYNYPDQGNWDDTTADANVEIQGGLYPHGIICEWEYTETPPVTILTANHLQGGIVNSNYSFQLKARSKADGTPTWSHVSGTLPTGLTLDSSGLLSGNPTSAGSFDFTVKVAESTSNYDIKTFTLEITSACVAPVITTVDLKDVNVNNEYHKTLEAKGSFAIWSIIDKYLPSNLSLSPIGEITGKPNIDGTYEFTVRAKNDAGYSDKTFTLNVVNASFPVTEMENEEDVQENNGTNETNGEQSANTQPNQQGTIPEANNPQEQNNIQNNNSFDSSGGCSSSFSLSGLLLLTLFLVKKIKSKHFCSVIPPKMRNMCFLIFTVALFLLFPLRITEVIGATHSTTSTVSNKALSRMQQLHKENKIPAYVLENGIYEYAEGITSAHVQGKNVFMRSQPSKNARIITKLTHIDVEYLGEWTHPTNHEKWFCVKRNGEIGWVYGQYINLVKGRTKETDVTRTANVAETPRTESSSGMTMAVDSRYSDVKPNHGINLKDINWKYVFGVVITLSLAYVILSLLTGKRLSIEGIVKFFYWSAVVAVVCFIGYFFLKFILKLMWEEIILPILSGLFLVLGFVLFAGHDVSIHEGKSSGGLCPYYARSYCDGCPKLKRDNNDPYTDLHMCEAIGCYVNPKQSPRDQSLRLENAKRAKRKKYF